MQKYLSFLNQKKQRLKTSVWHSKRYFFVNYTVSKMIRELGLDAKNAAAGYWLGFPLPSCFCCQMVNCSWWPSLGCPPEQRCHSTPQHTLNKDLHFQVLLDQFLRQRLDQSMHAAQILKLPVFLKELWTTSCCIFFSTFWLIFSPFSF